MDVTLQNFGNTTPNKFSTWSHWVESVLQHNAQHVTELGQYSSKSSTDLVDSYNLQIRLTVADFATAQLNYTFVLLFVCGFHKLFWIPQIQLRIPHIRLFWSDFDRHSVLGICSWNPKQPRRTRKIAMLRIPQNIC